ncbi:MAG: hypothetical protein KAR06_08495, partial [Deltaproteobacteria bacterium]|nr:hypothetical protein [Deltaproteobacteria bacterium]
MFKKLINRIDNINSPVKRTLFVSGVFGFLGVLISIVFLGSFYVMFVGVESYIVPMNRYSLLVSGIETGFYGFLNGFSVRSVINLLFILVAISVVLFIFLYALLFVISKIHAIRALKLARWRSILFIIIGFGLLVLITEAITVDQRKLSFPRFFYETLLFGLLFVFTAGGGYINCLSMDKGALALKYRLGENPLLGSLVRGIVAGIITLSIISLLNHYYSYVYEYLNFSFHLNGIDYSYFTQNFIFTGVFFTVYAFISGGVLSAMMPSGISLRDRIKSLAVPLSVTIVFAFACFIV